MHLRLIERATTAIATAMAPVPRYELRTMMNDLTPSDRACLAHALRDVSYAVTGVLGPEPVIAADLLIVDPDA